MNPSDPSDQETGGQIARFFVGYGDVDGLLTHARRLQPIFVNAVGQHVSGGQYALGLQRCWLAIAFLEGDVCHYCRVPYACYQTHCGRPFGHLEELKAQRVRDTSAWLVRVCRHYLEEKGFQDVREAHVAVPRDLSLLDGEFGFLVWDEQLRRWRRKTAAEGEIDELARVVSQAIDHEPQPASH